MTLISDTTTVGMSKLKETYQYVFMGILLATMGAIFMMPYAAALSGWVYWSLVIVEFIVLFLFMFRQNIITYFVFTLLTGITLVPMLAYYIGSGASGAIVQALIGTSVITAGLTLYATTTTKNYLSMGQTLMWILIGLVVMSIANIFIGSSVLSTLVSMVVVVLFSFFIIYDTQTVLHTDITPLDAAMNIYLDVLNMFINILNLLGIGSSDD